MFDVPSVFCKIRDARILPFVSTLGALSDMMNLRLLLFVELPDWVDETSDVVLTVVGEVELGELDRNKITAPAPTTSIAMTAIATRLRRIVFFDSRA